MTHLGVRTSTIATPGSAPSGRTEHFSAGDWTSQQASRGLRGSMRCAAPPRHCEGVSMPCCAGMNKPAAFWKGRPPSSEIRSCPIAAGDSLAASLQAGLVPASGEDKVVLGESGAQRAENVRPHDQRSPSGVARTDGRGLGSDRATEVTRDSPTELRTVAISCRARSPAAGWGRFSRAVTSTSAAIWRSRCCWISTRTSRRSCSGSSRKRRSAGSCSIRGSRRCTNWGNSPTSGRSSA